MRTLVKQSDHDQIKYQRQIAREEMKAAEEKNNEVKRPWLKKEQK